MADSPRSPLSPNSPTTRLPMPASTQQIPQLTKDANRRRSLLLPPGTLVAAQRGSLALPSTREEMSSLGGAGIKKSVRPMTVFEGDLGSLADLSKRLAEEGHVDGESGGTEEDARATAHAQLTGEGQGKSKVGMVQRSQSLRKAGAVSGLERSGSLNSRGANARNSTTVPSTTGRSLRPLSTLQESNHRQPRTSRPPSSASMKSPSSASPTKSAMERNSVMGPPPPKTKLPSSIPSNTGLKRANSTASRTGHDRTQSARSSASTSSNPGNGLPRPTDLRRRPTNEESAEARGLGLKPAFSTLQQHYSPRKNPGIPKPASSTLINAQPPSDPTTSMSLDVQFSQARLLQLSILHRDSLITAKKWEASANKKLGKKFDAMAEKCTSVQEEEKEVRKRANVDALRSWANSGQFDEILLSENIRNLATVVNEVLALVEDEGRVAGLLDIFEHWIEWVGGIWASRSDQSSSQAEVEFVEGLGEAWRSECRALVRKLSSLGRNLESLERPKEGSSLRRLMDVITQMIKASLDELNMVLRLEAEVVEREVRWVDEGVGRLETELGIR